MTTITIEKVIVIAKKAGKEILNKYNQNFEIKYKEDQSPLTKADLAAHNIIVKELQKLNPEIPILSEESTEKEYQTRKKWKLFWLVDPLDGTKEFIKKNGEFTVNIALIKEGKATQGVVHIPVQDITYYSDGKKSYKQKADEPAERITTRKEKKKLTIVASKSHLTEETKSFIDQLNEEYELISKGSSLKFCIIAEGKADIYPRLAPTMEWDSAAAHAIVKTAGKNVYNYGTGEELKYNKQNLLNPYFIVK